MWVCDPSTTARTRCRLGRVRFLVLLLAWDTWLPTRGPLPQISHLNATTTLLPERNAGLCPEPGAKSSRAHRLPPRHGEGLLGCHAGGENLSLQPEPRIGRLRGEQDPLVAFGGGPQPDRVGVFVRVQDRVRLQWVEVRRLVQDVAVEERKHGLKRVPDRGQQALRVREP